MNSDRFHAVRAVALGLWSWVVLAGILAVFNGMRAAAAVLGPSGTPESARQIRDTIGGPVDVFLSTVTLQFGHSWVVAPQTTVWALLGNRLQPTLTIAVLAGLATAGIAILGSRVTPRHPRLRTALLAPAAVPGLALLYGLLRFAADQRLDWATGDIGLVLAALALAAPLGLGLVVLGNDPERELLAWPYALWFATLLPITERVFAVRGIGWTWFESITQGDFPLTVGASALLAIPVIVGAVVRDVVRETDAAPALARPVSTDGGADSVSLTALRSSPRVLAGAGLLALLALVAFVTDPTLTEQFSPGDSVRIPVVLRALDDTVVAVLLTTGIATCLGVGLGALATTSRTAETAIRAVTDPLGNLPIAVVLVPLLFFEGRLGAPDKTLRAAALLGLALTPLVLRAVQRASEDPIRRLLAGAGTATVGAGVFTFLFTDLSNYGLASRELTAIAYGSRAPFWTAIELTVTVVPFVLALFLLGTGLRRQSRS